MIARNIHRPSIMVLSIFAVALLCGGCAKRTGNTDLTTNGRNGSANGPGSETDRDGAAVDNGAAGQDQLALNDIFFSYDDASLAVEARAALARNGDLLKEKSDVRLTIEGHCDERGTVEYNLALGQLRAEAARAYLVKYGVPATRLNTISYGEMKPFVDGTGESAWAQNRRAHFMAEAGR